jgi:hypothetical protein
VLDRVAADVTRVDPAEWQGHPHPCPEPPTPTPFKVPRLG